MAAIKNKTQNLVIKLFKKVHFQLIMQDIKLINLVMRLWLYIDRRRKRQFFVLLALMLAASFLEILTVGAIIPFLGVLLSPEKFISEKQIYDELHFFSSDKEINLALLITIIFCLLVLISGIVRYLLLWVNTRFSFSLGSDISTDIYRRVLCQPYSYHISQNTSEIINAVMIRANGAITLVLHPVLNMIISIILLLIAIIFMSIVSFKLTFLILLIVTFFYISIAKYTRNKLLINGEKISKLSNKQLKHLQEGCGGIRDVIIGSNQNYFIKLFEIADKSLRFAQGQNLIIGNTPRYIIETGSTLVIALAAFILMSDRQQLLIQIPTLTVVIISLQKILVQVQILYSSWVILKGNESSLKDTINLLESESKVSTSKQILKFNRNIRLKNINLIYGSQKHPVLEGVNLEIIKGSIFGIIGKTGAGKSSILDVLMGLTEPSSGCLYVDDFRINHQTISAWQGNISHVPQSIYLADTSVLENIAFGVDIDKIDIEKAKNAAEIAQIANVIDTWDSGYNTIVGERGSRISGGQRQRIGIARAIYKNANILILDEATNALDLETENKVMQSLCDLAKSGKTIIIVSHSEAILKYCHYIYNASTGITKNNLIL